MGSMLQGGRGDADGAGTMGNVHESRRLAGAPALVFAVQQWACCVLANLSSCAEASICPGHRFAHAAVRAHLSSSLISSLCMVLIMNWSSWEMKNTLQPSGECRQRARGA